MDDCVCDHDSCDHRFDAAQAYDLAVRVDALALLRPELPRHFSRRFSTVRHWHFCSVACRTAWWSRGGVGDYQVIIGPSEVTTRHAYDCPEFFCAHDGSGHMFDEHLVLHRVEKDEMGPWIVCEARYFACPHTLNAWWRKEKPCQTMQPLTACA